MVRLSPLLPFIISAEQSDFVKDRLIHDNILLAQELITHIKKKKRGSNIVMKLDIARAYDSLNWVALTRL